MEGGKPHRSRSSGGSGELFICFTSRASSSSNASSSMKVSSKSVLSPGRTDKFRDGSSTTLHFSLSRRLRSNGSVKGGQASPMFPAGGKKKGCSFDTPEPSSPKVTCIGQVRVKTKKQGKKMRSRSRRRGDASFRRGEPGQEGQRPPPQECLPNRNQRWVHLPLNICEALKTFGAEFNCFLPCGGRSSCSQAGMQREKRGKTPAGAEVAPAPRTPTGSCAAVFSRWLMALQESEEEKNWDVEAAEENVGLAGEEEESRREKPVEMNVDTKGEIEDEDEDEDEDEEVNICIPPKNALLLMRCRSEPLRMSSFAPRFWESPARRDGEGEEEEDEEEEAADGDDEEEVEAEDESAEIDGKECRTEGLGLEAKECEEGLSENEEIADENLIEIDVHIGAASGNEELGKEQVLESSTSSQDHGFSAEVDSSTVHAAAAASEASEPHEERKQNEEEAGAQEFGGDDELTVPENYIPILQEGEHLQGNDKWLELEKIEIHFQMMDGKEEQEVEREEEAEVDKNEIHFQMLEGKEEEEEEREKEAEVDIEGSAEVAESESDEPVTAIIEDGGEEILAFQREAMDDEIGMFLAAVAEDGTEESATRSITAPAAATTSTAESKAESEMGSAAKCRGTEQLPDCLLLMMCEPKLSMEVSKETWVCSTDFLRCRPSRPPALGQHQNPPDQLLGQQREPNDVAGGERRRLSVDGANPPPLRQAHPAATVVEQKLVSAAAYGPFVLTRCKSEPMRSSAKLAPEACFWKARKLPTFSMGAAGIGF